MVNYPENHPRSERKHRVRKFLEKYAFADIGSPPYTDEQKKLILEQNMLCEPSVINTDELIPIKKAAEIYGIDLNIILELGYEGIVELCAPIDKEKAVIHVLNKHYIARTDPLSSQETKVATGIIASMQSINFSCQDFEQTEWITLSREDCRKVLKSGSAQQSVFESGWKMTNSGEFITTYPRFKSTSIEVLGQSTASDWRFKSFSRDDNHIERYQGNHVPLLPISITIWPDKILVPKIFLDKHIENIKNENKIESQKSYDEYEFSRILNGDKPPELLADITKLAKVIFDKYQNKNYEIYQNRIYILKEITLILKNHKPEKPKKQNNKPSNLNTIAEEVARIISPENYRRENFHEAPPKSHITKKMIGLATAYDRFFLQKHDTNIIKNDDIIEYLTNKDNGYGFVKSSAKNSISIISEGGRRGARPKNTQEK